MVRGVIIRRWLDPQILTFSPLSHLPLSVGTNRRSGFQSVTEFTNDCLQRAKTQVGRRTEEKRGLNNFFFKSVERFELLLSRLDRYNSCFQRIKESL